MAEPTAATITKSTVGLKNVVVTPVTTDTESTITYGTTQAMAGAINVEISPNNADPDVQYADDVEFDVMNPDPDVSITLEMADIPMNIRTLLLGEATDDHGVVISKAGDSPTYFALGFKSEKTNGKFRYVWLYKCRAKPMTETFNTKEGETITRQTGKLEITAIKRTYDGAWKAVADEDMTGVSAIASTFLEAPYSEYHQNSGT